MRTAEDLTGLRFGKLIVIRRAPNQVFPSGQIAKWVCICDCGNECIVGRPGLKNGRTTSCGCSKGTLRHGHTKSGTQSPTYNSWHAMLSRCYHPSNVSYADYGGRGISVCERWHLFDNFLADMGERPEGKTLDRYPNNDGNYEPGNCRWATRKEQNANRRT